MTDLNFLITSSDTLCFLYSTLWICCESECCLISLNDIVKYNVVHNYMHLMLLTNWGREGILLSWFDFYPHFLLWCCLFNRVNNFYVQFVSRFLHWLFLAASPSMAWLVESQSWQVGWCLHIVLSTSFYKAGYLHWRQFLPLGGNLSFVYTEKCLCEIQTLWILVV